MRKLAAAAVVTVLGLSSSLAQAAPGEYWEMTNKMEMQGMAMPGMTNKVCMAKGSEKDPSQAADKDCTMTDMKSSGNKSSWKMRCNKDGEVMTGSGEMTSTPDRTEGTMNFSSATTGNITMRFVNKRVGGACDTDEMQKKMEGQVAAANKEMAKSCEGAKTARDWLNISSLILGKAAPCADKKAQLCEVMQRDAGRDLDLYFTLKRGSGSITKDCGLRMDSVKKSICKSVDANNADFRKQLRSDAGATYRQQLRAECPAEMKTYAEASRKRYCEGRGFTEKQRMSLAACLKGDSGDDAMQVADPDEPPMPAGRSDAAKNEPAKNDSGIKLPGGITIPGVPGGGEVSPDSLIDGAKKLKNLFGL